MNSRFSSSPLRDKRRQSDAKWRASVATCYDALKYVIPNVKNLSKKKISKALILQECEKHIQSLEDTINFLFNIECKNRGQVAFWKEGQNWTHCSMENLHSDFVEQQRKVFASSTHGRRCYNLLRDIKEDVFTMTVDPTQLQFVREDNLDISRTSDNLSETSCSSSRVPVIQLTAENIKNIKFSKGITSLEKQQASLQQLLMYEIEAEKDLGFKGLDHSESMDSVVPSVFILPKDSSDNKEDQVVHSLPSSTTSTCIPEVSSSNHISLTVPGISDETNRACHSNESNGVNKSKPETITNTFYILSSEKDYTCLLRALEAEQEQEVPSMENSIKTTKIKRPRLSNPDNASDCFAGNYATTYLGNNRDCGCLRNCSPQENLYAAENNTGCIPQSSRNNNLTLASSSGSFSNHTYLNLSDIKIEADQPISCGSHDPMLSSFNTPKSDWDMSLSSISECDSLVKQQLKHKSARKRLNFNCPSISGWYQNSPQLFTPDKNTQRSSVRGFTPVKLPDDMTFTTDQDNPLNFLTSPWKTLDSPFSIRKEYQGYFDSNTAELEDSLLCSEKIDSVDFDSLDAEVTPVANHHSDESQKPGQQKAKGFSLPESDTKVMPKCRRRLERFYDEAVLSGIHTSLSDESHVVPQLDTTLWNSSSPLRVDHSSKDAMFDIGESLVCLETLETIELDEDIDI